MVWIPLRNGSGQVVQDIVLSAPVGGIVYTNEDTQIKLTETREFTVTRTKRIGINRYKLFLTDGYWTMNYHIRKTKTRPGWEITGKWHTPEQISEMFGNKLDPDANKPRPQRESFWKMCSRKGSHNYRQKVRLMQLPEFEKFKNYFDTTIER